MNFLKNKVLTAFLSLAILTSGQSQAFVQGHRGCRGLMPENTVPAFVHAVELGVVVLELDVVISADSVPVVSHEPWFHNLFTTLPDGRPLKKDDELNHNIYALSYEQIKMYDVGLRTHPGYPAQKSLPTHKPALHEVFDTIEKVKPGKIWYNIEIKRRKEWDNIYHPPVALFVKLIMDEIQKFNLQERIIIQSFDHESLIYLKNNYPKIKMAILVEDIRTPRQHLEILGFTPDIYSPYYKLIDQNVVAEVKSLGMNVVPWTVNDVETAQKLISYNVDGIITDYPDRILSLIHE